MYFHKLTTSFFPGFQMLAVSASVVTALLIILMILFLLSFMLAGSEVAFFSLNAKDINVLKRKKQPSYRRIISLLEYPKTLMATLLIANSLINIGIILISNILLDHLIHVDGMVVNFLIKVIVVTFFLVLFAEVLPKVWATHHKIWFASSTSLGVEIFYSLFFRLGKKFTNHIDRFERYFSSDRQEVVDQSNLDIAIDLLPEEEASKAEKQILKGIRKFGGITVKQVMKTRLDVSGIDAKTSFESVIRLSEEFHYSRLPVYRSSLDDIIGILHMKDLLPHLQESADFDWHTLIRTPFYIHEHKLIEDLLQEFRTKRIHFAIVVDEFGGTSGIVTLEDIIEEVTGDIKDEFDEEESANKKINEFEYVLEGRTMINDACKIMNIPVSVFEQVRGDSDSMAGLLLEIAGAFPAVNEPLVWHEYTFIPMEINRNRIEKIKLIIQPKNEMN